MEKGVIKVKQIRSPIRRPGNQRACLVGLGLNRIGREARLENTAPIRGMIAKVSHLVSVLVEIKRLISRRFNALGGYARNPGTVHYLEELEWFATGGDRLLGVLVRDLVDDDYGWIILGRDERLRFRAAQVNASLPSAATARDELLQQLERHNGEPDEAFHQGDAEGAPTEFSHRSGRKTACIHPLESSAHSRAIHRHAK